MDFKTIKQLAESVRTYRVSSAFVVAQVKVLARYCLIPGDWNNITWACLSSRQYLDWKSLSSEYANSQAAANLATGQDPQRHWDADMLLGLGRFALDQTNYPEAVYTQINEVATKAWKALPNKGAVSGNLTKILQGPTEPFSDFVAHLVEAATRIFVAPDKVQMGKLGEFLGTRVTPHSITPQKVELYKIHLKTLNDFQKLLGDINWIHPYMRLSNSELTPLFDMLKGDPQLSSPPPRALTPEA